MGWFSNLLLPGRLRTGPTALLPARPDPKTLLAVAQLADPEARADGDDILAGGSRIQAPIELSPDILAKLGVPDEDRLWACRIAADGPLPVDYFDKSLAEGIAYRLGGWSLCQGEPFDPAEDDGDPLVCLPAVPEPEEAVAILTGLLAHAVDTGRWPDGELVEGVVHVAVRQGRVSDVYAGADIVVTIEEGHRIPPAAQVRWPYLTEIAIARVSSAVQETPEAAEDEAGETAAPEDADAEQAVRAEPAGDSDADGARVALVARATVAIALAHRLQGIATDGRGFQLAEPADVLPGRFA